MKNLTEIKADKQIHIIDEVKYGICGTCKGMTFVFTWDSGWEHLSVSWRHRCPTWDEMCAMKEKFFKDDEACVEYHPKKSEYVNIHPFCLHIWRPIKQELITPPPQLVI